ncbi:MAG: GDSL family lipase, partial [Kribbellaceae bacterium]|nr:GDSL family lipase [Kribbellaceae bacterium]
LAAGNNPEHWLFDGVHPTPAGHQALAEAWLRQVE